MKYLYLAVTPDKYELPIAVADNVSELSRMIGFESKRIRESINRRLSGKKNGIKFIKVSMEDLDHE